MKTIMVNILAVLLFFILVLTALFNIILNSWGVNFEKRNEVDKL